MNYSKALDIAIQRCGDNYIDEWQRFYHIYPFTTENISGFIKYFDLKDKSLLTVGSSCDQVLNAILMDAKSITLLDVNPFVKYYYYLKVAAIIELNMDEYLLFMRYKDYPIVFKDNIDVFNKETFDKIVPVLRLLDYESYLFWDDLFQMYAPIVVRKKLFSNDENRDSIIKQCNPYLKNDALYNQLRGKILSIKPIFIKGNIREVNITNKYDNIWFSNIFTNGYTLEKIKEICIKYNKCLNDGGMMLISYLYDTTKKTEFQNDWCDIYNLDVIFNILGDYDPELKTFTGVKGFLFEDSKYKRDSVLIYKKKK